ncbi:MAG: Putatie phospholipase/carboxylesterase [Dehalococcoidia bacterium]|nr:Putatie phospholipase/carboxylesterase [Dehalococcoidia bacterium]
MESNPRPMQTQTQRGRDLTYLTVYPEEYDPALSYPLVILLHGLGANMYDLASLAPAIESRGYLYVCPNAPIPMQIGQGMIGFAWTSPGSGDPEEGLRSERYLEGLWEEVMERYHVSPGRAMLLGFSQGGGMTYRCGLGRPDLFAGLVALSAFLRDPEEMRSRLPLERSQPIFIAHGLQDNPERGRRSFEFLTSEGYTPYYREYDMGHEISQDVLADLVPWMRQVLPPLRRDV